MSALRRGALELVRWVPVGLVPLVNGLVRMTTYQRLLGEQASGWVSACLDVAAIVAYALVSRPPESRWLRGGVWLACTTVFHFALGRAFGLTPADSLRKYDLLAGEPWLVVSVVVGASPWLAAALRRWRNADS